MKIKNIFSKSWFLLKNTFLEFNDDNAIKLSAALSYYTIFALPPLLIIIITICGFFFGEDAVTGQLYGQINGLVGNGAAIQIQEAIKNVQLSGDNVFATIFGIAMLLIGASEFLLKYKVLSTLFGAYVQNRIKVLKNSFKIV